VSDLVQRDTLIGRLRRVRYVQQCSIENGPVGEDAKIVVSESKYDAELESSDIDIC
jgi:hypothetical protein